MNELIERYVAAALEPVPEKQRTEVHTEIRGAIDEMVAPRLDAGEPESDAVRAALTELGDPAKLAMAYSDRQSYLIGPGWYPAYIRALKSILGVVLPIVVAISLLDSIGGDNASAGEAIGDLVESVLWGGAMVYEGAGDRHALLLAA